MAVQRAVRAGPRRRRGRARLPAKRRACPRTPTPRPTPRCAWKWTTGAGPGVPFYLRTGKRLARKVTEIAVTLKPVPHLAFSQDGSLGVQPNQLVLTLQPNEGVSLRLGAKIPGTRMIIRPVNMEFLYGTAFLSQSPEAYERLITDAMRGDATLFTRNDEVEAQWRICDPIVDAWAAASRAAAHLRSGLAGPGGGRAAAARGRPLARDLMRAASDAVWSEQGTTPDAIEAALRELLVERHAENEQLRARARAQHDRVRRPRMDAARSPTACAASGRYHASRLVVLAYEPRRERLDARVMIASEGDPDAGRARAAARDGGGGTRRPATSTTCSRSPTRSSSPTCPRCCGRRTATTRSWRSCSPLSQAVLRRLGRRAGRRGGARARVRAQRARLRGGPRVAALDALARAGGGRRSTRPRCAANCARSPPHGPPPPRLDGRGDAARRLARLAPGVGGSAAAWPTATRSSGKAARPLARTWRCACRPRPSCWCAASRASTLETAAGRLLRLDRGPGGLRAHARGRARRRARMDDPRRLARRDAACSARASARRCCATPPTCPRCGPRGDAAS